jgi:hypothetical protein
MDPVKASSDGGPLTPRTKSLQEDSWLPLSLRQGCVEVATHNYFETTVLLIVIANLVFLALDSPVQSISGNFSYVLKLSEFVFASLFTVEASIKIIAFGWFTMPLGYLRSYYNILDLIIVFFSWVALLPINSSLLVGVRALRALRPLRTVQRLPLLRLLTNCIIESLPSLGDALVFSMFLFSIFAVVATSEWRGLFHNQ